MRNVQRVKTLVQDVSRFGPEKFHSSINPRLHNQLPEQHCSDSHVGINQRIMQRFGRPITGEALSQLNADAELLK
mgnify:CR=1 FL=1